MQCKTDICKTPHQAPSAQTAQDCGIQSVQRRLTTFITFDSPPWLLPAPRAGESADQGNISIFHFYITHYYNISLKGQNYVL